MAKVIGLVPARSGSKGLPGKNIRDLNGRPLIRWTVDEALDSGIFDQIFISSDSKEILSACSISSAKVVTVERDKSLAGDHSTTEEVLLNFFESQCINTGICVLLQPTSPGRNKSHLVEAFRKFRSSQADILISGQYIDSTCLKIFLEVDDKLISDGSENYAFMPRQSLPKVFKPNGAIYIFSIAIFLAKKGFPTHNIIPYPMNKESSRDIDNIADFEFFERYLL